MKEVFLLGQIQIVVGGDGAGSGVTQRLVAFVEFAADGFAERSSGFQSHDSPAKVSTPNMCQRPCFLCCVAFCDSLVKLGKGFGIYLAKL